MKHQFRRGQEILVSGRRFQIVDRISTGEIRLRNIVTDELTARPMKYLVDELFAGRLEIVTKGTGTFTNKRMPEKLLTKDFKDFPLDKRTDAKRRMQYITEYETRQEYRKTKKALNPIITYVRKKINDQKPPSWITFYRWLRNYKASGGDIRVLVSLDSGCKGHRLNSVIDGIITDAFNENYLKQERPPVGDVNDAVILKVKDENLFRTGVDKLRTPHVNTIYRRKDELDPYDVKKARHGKKAADRQFGQHKRGKKPTRPLERVELDATKSDLFVIDTETRLPIGRPWLVSAIDVNTRCIAGIYWSFMPPSYCALMQCLLHAIQPKHYVKEKYPDIKHTWDTYGVMENAVPDNGREFHSDDFVDAALDLGIVIQYSPKQCPEDKGTIERWFRTQNQRLLHSQPGTSFSNIIDREDYNPKENAIIDYETFNHILHVWIVDDYHQNKHGGVEDIPSHLWKIGTEQFPPHLPSSKNKLRVLLGSVYERTITASGIELHGLFYNSDALGLIRKGRSGKPTKVKADLTDLGMIHVHDDFHDIYVPVPVCEVWRNYANGLTLWQHQIIRRHAIKQLKGRTDPVALAMAREWIREIVAESWNKRLKTSTSVRMARYLNIDQNRALEQADNSLIQGSGTGVATPQKSFIVVEGTGKGLDGISNSQAALPAPGEELQGDIIEGELQGETGAVEQHLTKLSRKASRNGRAHAPTKKHNEKKAQPAMDDQGDGPIDMSGWRGSYEMPTHKEVHVEKQ